MIGDILWTPPRDLRQSTEIGRYMNWLREERGRELDTYDELWRWSVEDLEGFGGRSGISTASAPMPRTTASSVPVGCRGRSGFPGRGSTMPSIWWVPMTTAIASPCSPAPRPARRWS